MSNPDHPQGTRSASGDTTDRIRAAIYDGTLASGELLIEEELQAWLGAPAEDVRAALETLEQLGLVVSTTHERGKVKTYYVPDPPDGNLDD